MAWKGIVGDKHGPVVRGIIAWVVVGIIGAIILFLVRHG